jgi:hypothetical protein
LTDEAKKFDDDKVPLHLIDPLWNWAKGEGLEWHRVYRAAIGHLNAWYAGQDIDAESKLPHLWHANCCLMFLTRYTHDGMGKDTRPTFPFEERETKAERDRRIVEALAMLPPTGDANEVKLPPFVYGVPTPERNPRYFKSDLSEDQHHEASTQEETATR